MHWKQFVIAVEHAAQVVFEEYNPVGQVRHEALLLQIKQPGIETEQT